MQNTTPSISRREFSRKLLASVGGAMLTPSLARALTAGADEKRPNVLFIAVDDLRPEMGCYGSKIAKTPNIDRLAKSGVLFENHFTQFAVCIPSRASLLTSLRPERTHQVYGPTVWDKVAGVKTFGNTFHEGGYATVSLGKIWHTIGKSTDRFDVAIAETGRSFYADPKNLELFESWRKAKVAKGGNQGDDTDLAGNAPIVECYDAPDDHYLDGTLANEAISQMKRLKGGEKPFMLAVGFHKPHIPFCAPKRYWDLYDRATLPLSSQPNFPKGTPDIAWSKNPNFHNYDYEKLPPLPKGNAHTEVMPEASAREIRHGYFACVSFVDAQIGKVLDSLEREGLADNTIVVLWTDHGFHLGDQNQWGKQTNFETAAHTPLIVRAPGRTPANRRCSSIVETVDVFPTLLDLCGLAPLPVTDGQSLTPLLGKPDQEWKDAAFHVFNRRARLPGPDGGEAEPQLVIGHAIRTRTHRLVEWHPGWDLSRPAIATELYEYSADRMEVANLADEPSHADLRQKLSARLRAGPRRVAV